MSWTEVFALTMFLVFIAVMFLVSSIYRYRMARLMPGVTHNLVEITQSRWGGSVGICSCGERLQHRYSEDIVSEWQEHRTQVLRTELK